MFKIVRKKVPAFVNLSRSAPEVSEVCSGLGPVLIVSLVGMRSVVFRVIVLTNQPTIKETIKQTVV